MPGGESDIVNRGRPKINRTHHKVHRVLKIKAHRKMCFCVFNKMGREENNVCNCDL